MRTQFTPPVRLGFSLVELSIVLVILGLLVGGVLSGRSLIRAAELRSISTQYNQFYTATKTFRDKYFALPGDMNNATQFWGIAGGTGSDATCKTTASTDSRTCNGNGDGAIDDGFSFGFWAGSQERMRFWQHLANAQLIEGRYSGVDVSPASTNNLPPGKISNTYWAIYSYGKLPAAYWNFFEAQYGNTIIFGKTCGTRYPAIQTDCGGVTPENAWNVDKKMDDGKPGTGKIMISSRDGGVHACSDTAESADSAADAAVASYLLTNTKEDCTIIFRQQF